MPAGGARGNVGQAMRLGATVVAVLAAALCGTSASAETVSTPAVVSCGPRASALTVRDLRYAREYRHLLAARARTVWPGWRRVPPLLQRTRACEYLIGHPAPPRFFHRLAGVDVLGWRVYAARAGTLTPGVVASTWKVRATWVTMVPTRDEFQRALDRQLGRGAVRLSDTSYMRSLVHEAFHAQQMSVTGGRLPLFGSTIDERRAADLLSRLPAEARLAQEGEALAAGIRAASLEDARAAAATFAALRAARRTETEDPAALGAFERQIEWAEGAARYADLRLVELAGSGGYAPTPRIRYTPATAYRSAFLGELADPKPRADGLRGRWQNTGAGQAMLLDRLFRGWRESLLPGGSSQEALLAEAVDVPPALAGFRVARIAVAGAGLRVALAERPSQWTAGLTGVADLRPLDGLLFTFGEDVSAAFGMRGALIPLDIGFFDAQGRLLGVQQMPVCASDPCPVYRPPAPYRFALEVPAGRLSALGPGSRLVVPA